MTIPDMTPWSYPKRRNTEEQTEVMAAMRTGPWRKGTPVLDSMLKSFRLIRITEQTCFWIVREQEGRKEKGRFKEMRDNRAVNWGSALSGHC